MTIEQVRDKTWKSSELLNLARKFAEEAAHLPEGSKERESLELRAQHLVDEARVLTETAKQEISKYK